MEWATRITVCNGKMMAAIHKNEAQELVELRALATRGAPRGRTLVRPADCIRLRDMVRVAPDEYLDAFGIARPSGYSDCHAVYLYEGKHSRLMVPALSLIRGILMPPARLMPLVFGPGFLDLVSTVNPNAQPARVEYCTETNHFNMHRRSDHWLRRLTWMRSHRSAFNMVSSVHQYAMRGRIDLRLPKGVGRGQYSGMVKDGTLYATTFALMHIDASDEPRLHNIGAKSSYSFFASLAKGDWPVPPNPDVGGLIQIRFNPRTMPRDADVQA